jgi:integrative and conjugative element protein (TIGR02256 family)
MSFMKSWATDDRKVLLNFSDAALEKFLQHIQTISCDCEAGGLLLGSVHGSNLLVTEATIPTIWDKRFRYLFERLPFGHDAIALARWKASKGTIRYLGEWHTHPEDSPRPSHLDRSEWNRLSSKRLDRRPLLAVIVGRKSLYVELVPASGRGPLLKSME